MELCPFKNQEKYVWDDNVLGIMSGDYVQEDFIIDNFSVSYLMPSQMTQQ